MGGIDSSSTLQIIVAIGSTATAAATAYVNGLFSTLKSWIEYKSKNKEITSKENEVTLKKGDYEISFNLNSINNVNGIEKLFIKTIEPEIKSSSNDKSN